MRESNCPHCGRPFVDWRLMGAHILSCVAKRQKALDDEWNSRHDSDQPTDADMNSPSMRAREYSQKRGTR